MDTKSNERPRILHVTSGTEFGGGYSVVLSLVEMARQHGLQADVHTQCPETIRMCKERGIRVFNFEGIDRPIRPHKDLWAVVRLARAIQGRYQVVHTHTTKGGAVGRLAAHLAKVPVVLHTVHGFAFHEFSSKMATHLGALAERVLAKRCDKMIFVNSFDREQALKLKIASEQKMVTIFNGVPESRLDPCRKVTRQELLSELQIDEDCFLCAFVGRLAPQKGLKYLMEAIALLKRKMVNREVHLAVIGNGKLEAEVRRQIHTLDITDRVHLLGFLIDGLRWTGGCDSFVLSSLWEGHSVTLLEAMGLGRPIVATDIKGNRETITQEHNGLLVPPADPEALAAAIMRMASDIDFAKSLGSCARQTFKERFTLEKMLERTWAVYQEVLEANRLL
jgi:glycosyltransferase involved in cell wall biosynthesis